MTTSSPAPNKQLGTQDAYRFLADASSLLSASLDYEVTLSQVARLVVPRLADWAVVDASHAAGPKWVARAAVAVTGTGRTAGDLAVPAAVTRR